ncbi:MAG TPA: hypothetical protein PK280_11390 [Planctomycetota bacterium]|nr:hypothetical protein [Planctomycetota bacterium]
MRIAALLISTLFAAAPASPGEPAFTAKPAVTRTGDRYKIEFAVNRETDVAVSIEDAKGAVVRHLAAGVLGKNPPAPLKADSLSQSLEWDGKDDDGKPAAGGPFKVRVGLGLKAGYAGQAFAEKGQSGPNRVEGVLGMAVGPDGRLYVLDRCNGHAWGGSKVLTFRRSGAYEKTIKPFPSNTPAEKAKAAGAFINSSGGLNPLKFGYNCLSFYPVDDIAHQPAVTADGGLLHAVAGGRLAVFDRDGGLPEDAFTGPALGADLRYGAYPVLAASSDSRSVFISGLIQGKGKAATAVYRAGSAERGPAEAWFGDASAPGSDQTHLNDARGIAADGQGHLLIADFGNNRVLAVREKDKSVAGSFEVPAPEWLAAHPKTGAVYVQSGRNVIKFSGWSNAKEVARFELAKPAYAEFGPWRLAFDGAAEPPVLWAACAAKIVRYEDQGAKFSEPVPADCFAARTFYRPAADPTRREVLCKTMDGPYLARVRILDEATGEVRVVPGSEGKYGVAGIQGQQHRLGPDGSIYYEHYWDYVGISRYDRNGKKKPFEATAQDPHLQGRLPFGYDGTTNWGRDFSVDRKGDVYVKARGPEYHGLVSVHVYGPDGAFKRIALQVVSDGAYGPRVDPKGNLYIMEAVKPEGQLFPEEFKGPVAGFPAARDATDWIYGSIVKFGPEGGAVWFSGDQASPLTYEGWGQQHVRPGGSGTYKSIVNLRTTGGALTGTITMKSAKLRLPEGISVDTAANTKLTMRLKNDTDGNQAVLGYVTATPPGGEGGTKTIEIKPNSDYTEYTFDMAGEKDWKGFARSMYLIPSTATKGTFAIDWFRIGGTDSKLVWNFNAEDSQETKLPATMKKEKVGAYGRPGGAELQGALWWKPGFSPLGDMVSWTRAACHCTGADFDVDDFGRTFAPDAGRFRVSVLDTNGNAICSFGGYGNQDCCGPDSYVLDPETKVLRARREGDPKNLVSPFATPELGFAWIVGVAVTDRHAYVDDIVNKRVLRVKLGYAAEESCEIK